MSKKIVTSKAKVPENGCVIVRVRSEKKKAAIMQNIETSEELKKKARVRREKRAKREKQRRERLERIKKEKDVQAGKFGTLGDLLK
jgi:Flp pilus assembly protein TadB